MIYSVIIKLNQFTSDCKKQSHGQAQKTTVYYLLLLIKFFCEFNLTRKTKKQQKTSLLPSDKSYLKAPWYSVRSTHTPQVIRC